MITDGILKAHGNPSRRCHAAMKKEKSFTAHASACRMIEFPLYAAVEKMRFEMDGMHC